MLGHPINNKNKIFKDILYNNNQYTEITDHLYDTEIREHGIKLKNLKQTTDIWEKCHFQII